MNVLIGCEESQTVLTEFMKIPGINAYSCDILPTSGSHPDRHYQEDILKIITIRKWDMLIAFPPCTHLSKAGSQYWPAKQETGEQQNAIAFVKQLWYAGIEKTVIENPIGILNTNWMPSTQIIHPFEFGHPYSKPTCLWIRGLPKLKATKRVIPGKSWTDVNRNQQMRSKTFVGIAQAMAKQWTGIYWNQGQLF